jgi:hypothetical protein
MQVFSKKAFDFGGGIRIGKNQFGTLPDAVKKTQLYKWALADGSVRVITGEAKEEAKAKEE